MFMLIHIKMQSQVKKCNNNLYKKEIRTKNPDFLFLTKILSETFQKVFNDRFRTIDHKFSHLLHLTESLFV